MGTKGTSLSGGRLNFYLGRHWEGQRRDAKGRFCTDKQYNVERTEHENVRLMFDMKKYQRMYLALSKEYSRLLHENQLLKSILKKNGLELCNAARQDR